MQRPTQSKDVGAARRAALLLLSSIDRYTARRLIAALLVVAAGALLVSLTPLALKLVVDSIAAGNVSGRAVFLLVAMYVFGQYLSRCFTELRMSLHGHAEQRIRRHTARTLFNHLVRLPSRFHVEHNPGALGQVTEQGIHGYELVLYHLVYTVLPVTIELLTVSLVLAHFKHSFFLIILAAASFGYVVVFYRGASSTRAIAAEASHAHVNAHGVLNDALMNQETVKYFNAEQGVADRYDRALARTESAWQQFYTRRALNGVAVATIFGVSLGMSMFYALSEVARNAMTVGDFVLVNAYVVRLVQPLELLGFAVRDIAQGLAFLRSMLALYAQEREGLQTAGVEEPAGSGRGELAFKKVTFSYDEMRCVLRDISFSVAPGRTVAVVGASGSGKSSLMRLLFRLYEPSSGQILLDGVPIQQMSLPGVRAAIGIVPQDTVLFHDSIGNNIAFGKFGATPDEIIAAARVANLHEFIASLPEGYDSLVGERGLKLSGGERQRVAIARAALKQPRIYVFDEATSSLDSRTEKEILGNLRRLSERSTTLVIAHRISTIIHADQILVLDRGAIIERGTHEELCAAGGAYSVLWAAQQNTGQATKALRS